MGGWLLGFLIKDIKLFSVDRQAVVMSFVVPVLIASILGWLDSSASSAKPASRVNLLFVDLDRSEVSKAVLDRLQKSDSVRPTPVDLVEAERDVREGDASVAAILPKGFGAAAVAAMSGGKKPEVQLLADPSKPLEGQLVQGVLIQEASAVVATQAFGALAGDASAPLTVKGQQAGVGQANWSRAAHDYAGFGLQGLLFFAIEAAVGLARERRSGIWRRLRSSPVPPSVFILSRGISSTILAFAIILAIFAFGVVLFGIRVLGSSLGFFAVALATSLMAASFGLLITTIGKTESQSRGLAILIILVMLATGGAWFPLEQMPQWVQNAARYLPVRWSVEGFDAVTWRGLGFAESLRYSAALFLFAVLFWLVALYRFRTNREAV